MYDSVWSVEFVRRLLAGKDMFVHVLNSCSIYKAHVLVFVIFKSVFLHNSITLISALLFLMFFPLPLSFQPIKEMPELLYFF